MARLRPSHRRLMHWVAVGGVAILAVTGFNIAADRLPQLRGLQHLNSYVTRRPAS